MLWLVTRNRVGKEYTRKCVLRKKDLKLVEAKEICLQHESTKVCGEYDLSNKWGESNETNQWKITILLPMLPIPMWKGSQKWVDNCPVYGKTCLACKKKKHFRSVCRIKASRRQFRWATQMKILVTKKMPCKLKKLICHYLWSRYL